MIRPVYNSLAATARENDDDIATGEAGGSRAGEISAKTVSDILEEELQRDKV